MDLSESDSTFLSYLRALSIFVIVFGHVGGFWVFRPYSEFLHVFVPMFFFISGSLAIYSYNRSSGILDYFKKRLLGLLIPYYLICLLSIIIFCAINQQAPNINMHNVIKWLEIRPSKDIMPFPIGQVWFLHTLFIITLISPLYFYLLKKSSLLLSLVMAAIIVFSGIQLLIDVDTSFYFMHNNLYQPLIHSSFYMFGILFFGSSLQSRPTTLLGFSISCIALSVALYYLLEFNIDYAFHTFAPDLYYVAGSFFAITAMLIFRKQFVFIIQKMSLIENTFQFLYKYTFSIFLLHTLAIYLSETVFGLVEPQEKTVVYGIIKLAIVLIITGFLVIPFTRLSNAVLHYTQTLLHRHTDTATVNACG